jgi:replication-associated recombination protein RarA
VGFKQLYTERGFDAREVVSALQKMIRRGQTDDALYWAVELDRSGYGAWCWKRLRIITSEDIGPAWPEGPATIHALHQTFLDLRKAEVRSGQKSSRMILIHAVILLADAPKSRICDVANIVHYNDDEVRELPDVALDQHTARGKRMGRGQDHFWTEGVQLDHRQPHPLEDVYTPRAREIRSRPKSAAKPPVVGQTALGLDDDEPA